MSGSRMNKFSDVGLTPEPGKRVRSPSVAECPLNMEVKIAGVRTAGVGPHLDRGNVVHTDVVKDYDPSEVLIHWNGSSDALAGPEAAVSPAAAHLLPARPASSA